MQDEGPVRVVNVDLDEPGELLEVLLQVDDRHRVVEEHAEVAVEPHVDRRGLDHRVVEGIDLDPAGLDLLADGVVGEDHDGDASGRPRLR